MFNKRLYFMFVHVSPRALGGQKRLLEPLELELQVAAHNQWTAMGNLTKMQEEGRPGHCELSHYVTHVVPKATLTLRSVAVTLQAAGIDAED